MVVLYQFLQPSDQVSSLEGRTEITQPTNNAKKGKIYPHLGSQTTTEQVI